jgi:hypothetical protein
VLSELPKIPIPKMISIQSGWRKHYAPAGVGDHAPARAARTYPKLARSNHAKLDQNNCVAGSARQSRSNCADRRKRDAFAGPASTTAPPSLMQNTRSIGGAPVGHRQPHAHDVPSENAGDLEHIREEDAAVDRKLKICRGC